MPTRSNPTEGWPSSPASTRRVLETCLTETNATYRALLSQPGNLDQCKEAGKTVRRMAQCLADLDLIPNDTESGEDDFPDAISDE